MARHRQEKRSLSFDYLMSIPIEPIRPLYINFAQRYKKMSKIPKKSKIFLFFYKFYLFHTLQKPKKQNSTLTSTTTLTFSGFSTVEYNRKKMFFKFETNWGFCLARHNLTKEGVEVQGKGTYECTYNGTFTWSTTKV